MRAKSQAPKAGARAEDEAVAGWTAGGVGAARQAAGMPVEAATVTVAAVRVVGTATAAAARATAGVETEAGAMVEVDSERPRSLL